VIDIQAIYVRDVAELTGLDFVAMLRVTGVGVDEFGSVVNITEARVNSIPTEFIAVPPHDVLLRLPNIDQVPSGYKYADPDYVPGMIAFETIKNATFTWSDESGAHVGTKTYEGSVVNVLSKGTAGNNQFFAEPLVLKLHGKDFSKAVEVWVNGSGVPFTIFSKTMILCSIPETLSNISSVEIITTSKTIERTTFFSYQLGADLNTTTSLEKTVFQFIKLLLTTTGSDIFHPADGGDLQRWVGTTFAAQNPTSLIAKVVIKIQQIAASIIAGQMAANIPFNDRLAGAQLLQMAPDPDDPTNIMISLQINTMGGKMKAVSFMVSKMASSLQGAAELGSEISGTSTGSSYSGSTNIY